MAKILHPRALGAAIVPGLALAGALVASPAQAQIALQGASPAVLATVANIACSDTRIAGIAPAAQVAAVTTPVPTTVRAAKRAAILGGEMSALDRIRMQQSGQDAAMALQGDASVGEGLIPAAGGVRQPVANPCTGLQPGREAVALAPAARSPFGKDDFLASKKVRIGKTSMDSEWKRVRRESLRHTLRREFGTRAEADLATVEAVNRWVNRAISYVEDRDLFGKADYWAGARRTLRLGKGDCEDYALTKMQLLAAAGIDRDDMYLTIARDRVRAADHAVLVVRIEGRYVVLDNATDELLDGAQSHDYAPVLSFSDRQSWLHGY